MKKYNLSNLKGAVSNGKYIFLTSKECKGDIIFNIDIKICRADLNFKKYKDKGETYFLRLEKYDSKFPGDKEGGCVLELSVYFRTAEEVIDWLDKKGYLKREEWIKE